MRKILIITLILTIAMSLCCVPAYASSDIISDISGMFSSQIHEKIDQKVYLGGYPLGITIDGQGVTVVALREFIGEDGVLTSPSAKAGICVGDIIVSVDGMPVNNSNKLASISATSQGRSLSVEIVRFKHTFAVDIEPAMDLHNRQYSMGLWTRDSSSGIGTLTYIKPNLNYACLGHPICDSNGEIINASQGGIYYADINDVNKGRKGTAGELRGNFDINNRIGDIYVNNKYGIYGSMDQLPDYDNQLIDVASVSEVRVGKAEIYSTIANGERDCYKIEIIKAINQHSCDDKGMVIRVVDDRLLELTGGIVQGMSGSPIVQNGKLVGAVTHVFVNDPTRGYGVFAEWMLDN